MAKMVDFVQIIKQYPCLYNDRIVEYTRKDVTDKAWGEVAQRMNSTVSYCQTKWKNMKAGFVRSLKLNTSTKQRKLYYLHDELQFILPFVKAPIYTTEPGHTPKVADEYFGSNSSIKENCSTGCTFSTPCNKRVLNTAKSFKIRKVNNKVVDKTFFNGIKKRGSLIDNPRKMFLLSLLSDIESLSEEQMQKFRIKVLSLLEQIRTFT